MRIVHWDTIAQLSERGYIRVWFCSPEYLPIFIFLERHPFILEALSLSI